MKTVGMVGGLGPETTAEFYLEIERMCQKKGVAHRPSILISSVPISFELERSSIVEGKDVEQCIPLLTQAAEKLEAGGAEMLVMPCNSLHVFIDAIRQSVDIPVLSIVEETRVVLKQRGIKRVGLLATQITAKKRLYEDELQRHGIEVFHPDDFEQAQLGEVIHHLVMGVYSNKDREKVLGMIDHFEKQGVREVLLACTDLQLLLPNHPSMTIIDTMKLFAETVSNMLIESESL